MHSNVRYNKLSNRNKMRHAKKVTIPVDDGDEMDTVMLARAYSDDEDEEDDVDGHGDRDPEKHITFYANT